MKKVLVLCTGNSCRSQMAEGYLRLFSKNNTQIYSAGVETHGVNSRAISTMKEDSIDISAHTSNNISEYLDIDFDFIITVCESASEKCPYFASNAIRTHHSFPDPSHAIGTDEELNAEFRYVRNLIKDFCREYVKSNNL